MKNNLKRYSKTTRLAPQYATHNILRYYTEMKEVRQYSIGYIYPSKNSSGVKTTGGAMTTFSIVTVKSQD